MKLRCDLHVNGSQRKLLICQGPNEPGEHMALKLAAYLLFWDHEPLLDASTKTPALAQYEFLPDLVALDDGGAIKIWVECGTSTMNKLTKLTRRLTKERRIVVIKETARDAARLRQEIDLQLDRPQRVEILHWPGAMFKDWVAAATAGEKTEVYGEAGGLSINVVVNERPFAVDLAAV